MAKSKEKLKARELRKLGMSIKEIARKLKISAGSVSAWCRDIILTPSQIEDLGRRVTDPYYGKKLDYLERKQKEFQNKLSHLRLKGIREIGKLTKREIFLTGVALYWGEGFKKDHQVGFATSDKNMAKFFIYWLNRCFDIPTENLILRVTANIAHKSRIKQIEAYWSAHLEIPRSYFSKPFFQNSIWKKQYENPNLYYGVVRIKVKKSVDLLRRIYGHIEGLALGVS